MVRLDKHMDIPRYWRLKAQRYRLQGSLCPICGQPSLPPRPVCPHCLAQAANASDARDLLTTDSVAIAKVAPSVPHPLAESTIG